VSLVVLLSAKQGAGKTSTANALVEKLKQTNLDIRVLKFADPLYEMEGVVRAILRRYGEDHLAPAIPDGALLQVLGTEWGRKTRDPDLWVKIAKRRVTDRKAIYIFDDARFINEIESFDSHPFSPLKIRIECPEYLRKQRAHKWREATDHPSEISLDNYQGFHLTLDSSMLDTNSRAEMILQHIIQWLAV